MQNNANMKVSIANNNKKIAIMLSKKMTNLDYVLGLHKQRVVSHTRFKNLNKGTLERKYNTSQSPSAYNN